MVVTVTLLLDCISNPRNLGNLIRLACAVGAEVGLCGSVLSLRHPKVRSQIFTWLRPGDRITFEDLENRVRTFDHFSQAVEHFRAHGHRIIGTCPQAQKDYYNVNYLQNDVIAFGHEEGGLGAIKLALCDLVVKVPMPGGTNSLNVSDTAAVILYEALRQFITRDRQNASIH